MTPSVRQEEGDPDLIQDLVRAALRHARDVLSAVEVSQLARQQLETRELFGTWARADETEAFCATPAGHVRVHLDLLPAGAAESGRRVRLLCVPSALHQDVPWRAVEASIDEEGWISARSRHGSRGRMSQRTTPVQDQGSKGGMRRSARPR